MNDHLNWLRRYLFAAILCLLSTGGFTALATDNDSLVSQTVSNGTVIQPRTIFTQTWTLKNTGTTTWTPTQNGYTLNMIGKDSLGAITTYTNANSKMYLAKCIIGSGASIAPGGQATFSMMFIAPEAPGTYTDTFQLNSTSSVFFGPQVTTQIIVPATGNTNQYDRARAVSYANNNAGIVCSDGYFWTGSDPSTVSNFGAGAPVPTNVIGDDCAHFCSCCIGSQTNQRGGGINVPTRVAPSYGEPGAGHLIYTTLVAAGYAQEVSSLSQMSPGDLIGWNWEGDTSTNNIDHVTLYLGNGLIGAHASSHLDVSIPFYTNGSPGCAYHLIHIFDSPTLKMVKSSTNKMIFSWTTNWSGYSLYSATSLLPNATWTKVTPNPTKSGITNLVTNTVATGTRYYRLKMP